MKKVTVTLLVLAISLASFSSVTNYKEEMKSKLEILEKRDSTLNYMLLANDFQQIADQNQAEYLALYYAAFCNIIYSFKIANEKERDEVLLKSETQINKAMELSANNIELYILKALMYQAMIKVKPMVRGSEYSQKAQLLLNDANKMDETNPRVYFLTGQNIYYRPAMFGGGKEKAIPYYEKAEKLFAKAEITDIFQPSWGQNMNEEMIALCK